ncbi:ABC transporter substrate-binding protein [Nocardioides sp. AE5]|uniref:heme/hemin ABC transporter substrate-binding protein n=1 Tax=Nocardioides sp. AE5 TaxID=2962573 RepID=UPI002882A3E0|nr:ABC transporter substrate-binding protein [Nocardioides sp. AE5]MDT0201938.1 ABC transporter substrate-binding protein [Nocardioides sp. AE5]
MKNHHRLAAGITAVLILLGGCATTDRGTGLEGTEENTSTAAPAPDASNALELTGPAKAATIPDMAPVVTDPQTSFPATVTDATGKAVTITSADRVLALDLYGTLTDTIIGLGLVDRLVGRANSDLNPLMADLPVITSGGHDLSIEAILSLRPDLVLTNTTIGSEANYRQLESAGVTVVRFELVPSFEAIDGTIDLVAQSMGASEHAAELITAVDAEMIAARTEIEAMRAATPRTPKAVVLYVRGTAGIFFILGRDYGASDVLEALGLADVAAANGITDLKPANAEALVSLNPEIVLAMSHGIESAGGVDGFLKRPGMSATTAGQNRRVISAADNQLLAYGPRTPASLLALAKAIYTDDK